MPEQDKRDSQSSPIRTSRLYVKNLPPNWNEYDVYKLFKGYGIVYDVKLPDIEAHFTSRYGFVEMRCTSEVARAIENLNGVQDLKGLKEVEADFKLGSPLYVTWCQDNYRRKHMNNPRDTNINRAGGFGRLAGRDSRPVMGKHLGSNSPSPTAESHLDLPGDNLNSSVDSWASGEGELSSMMRSPGRNRQLVPVWHESLKKASLASNIRTKVLLLCAKAPNSFFVALESGMGEMQAFTDKLMDHYKGSSAPPRYHPELGEVCVVEWGWGEEREWTRGVILEYSRPKRFDKDRPNKAHCFLIDKGRTLWIDTNTLRPIHKDFVPFPAQAIHCGVNGVKPVGGGPTGMWRQEATELLTQWMDEAVTAWAELKGACGDKSLVEIIVQDREGKERFLSQQLIIRNFAEGVTERRKEAEERDSNRLDMSSVDRCLRLEDLMEPKLKCGEQTLVVLTHMEENGIANLVCVQEPKTDEFLTQGLMTVEMSHMKNKKVPGFKPAPGDVVTYHRKAYSRGVVLGGVLVPEHVWVENLETGSPQLIPIPDVHPADKTLAVWPPCRIKATLQPHYNLEENQLITGVFSKKNGEYEFAVQSISTSH